MSESNPWYVSFTSLKISQLTDDKTTTDACPFRLITMFSYGSIMFRGNNPFDEDQQNSGSHYLTNGEQQPQQLRGDNLGPNYDDGRPRPPILANYMYKVSIT